MLGQKGRRLCPSTPQELLLLPTRLRVTLHLTLPADKPLRMDLLSGLALLMVNRPTLPPPGLAVSFLAGNKEFYLLMQLLQTLLCKLSLLCGLLGMRREVQSFPSRPAPLMLSYLEVVRDF